MNSRSDWLSLDQNIIDTAINEWRKHHVPLFAQKADISHIFCKQLDK